MSNAQEAPRLAMAGLRPQLKSDPGPQVEIKPAIVRGSIGAPTIPLGSIAPGTDAISIFIDLEMEARKCTDLEALRFALVNTTRKLAAFDQAVLVEPSKLHGWSLSRVSSVSKIDRNAVFVRAIEAWLQHAANLPQLERGEPRLVNLNRDAKEWALHVQEFQFPYGLAIPVRGRNGRILAILLALKGESWRPQQSALMLPLADAYGHAWESLAPNIDAPLQRMKSLFSRSRLALALLIAAGCTAFIPVPLSALAPAEIVAAEPTLVTAPIEGVISDILVAPGTWVEKGATIVQFVDVKLRNDVEVAKREQSVAQARYFKVVQSATVSQKDVDELSTASAEFEVAKSQLAYAADLLARTQVKAARSGLLIYSAKSDLIGKPVALGERLLEIGDPAKPEIRIELPVSDAIAVHDGGSISLFLDGDPLSAIPGTLSRSSYRPTPTAEQQLAFRLYAKFADGAPRRIGLRGIARISGERVSLWFYLLRRPISAVRQRFGL